MSFTVLLSIRCNPGDCCTSIVAVPHGSSQVPTCAMYFRSLPAVSKRFIRPHRDGLLNEDISSSTQYKYMVHLSSNTVLILCISIKRKKKSGQLCSITVDDSEKQKHHQEVGGELQLIKQLNVVIYRSTLVYIKKTLHDIILNGFWNLFSVLNQLITW